MGSGAIKKMPDIQAYKIQRTFAIPHLGGVSPVLMGEAVLDVVTEFDK